MGGEKQVPETHVSRTRGSPPRGRGKDFLFLDRLFAQRITPAWAGKSCWCFCRSAGRRDHPRVGGEKLFDDGPGQGAQGSPPRGRGKVSSSKAASGVGRITPAWAGKSAALPSAPSGPRDHPRVGGEKTTDRPQGQAPAGSPPRGRGKVKDAIPPRRFVGITPAWAGKSLSTPPQLVIRRDHPRVGGEKTKKIP